MGGRNDRLTASKEARAACAVLSLLGGHIRRAFGGPANKKQNWSNDASRKETELCPRQLLSKAGQPRSAVATHSLVLTLEGESRASCATCLLPQSTQRQQDFASSLGPLPRQDIARPVSERGAPCEHAPHASAMIPPSNRRWRDVLIVLCSVCACARGPQRALQTRLVLVVTTVAGCVKPSMIHEELSSMMPAQSTALGHMTHALRNNTHTHTHTHTHTPHTREVGMQATGFAFIHPQETSANRNTPAFLRTLPGSTAAGPWLVGQPAPALRPR
jgi:hypothetical protein